MLSHKLMRVKNGKLILLWLFYSLALIYPSVQRYRALHSHVWDMGVFQSGLWNYSLGGTDLLLFSHHFSPILGIYALV